MKKIQKYVVITIVIFIIGNNVPYKYNNEDVVEYAVQNANSKSKCMCAWYVVRALHSGGCYPCAIYPAYAYTDILPKLGFIEISPQNLQRGDICVLSQNSKSQFGHIAIYDGKNWFSDYRQKKLYPNHAYENESTIHYYRQTNGWHKANIWISPNSLIGYITVLKNNYKRIKF